VFQGFQYNHSADPFVILSSSFFGSYWLQSFESRRASLDGIHRHW
ncbi:hypothetical protein VCHC62A1_1256B, partial [Vibrio cholerae HC-62A1]